MDKTNIINTQINTQIIKKPPREFLILDDCTNNISIEKQNELKNLLFHGRHYNLLSPLLIFNPFNNHLHSLNKDFSNKK